MYAAVIIILLGLLCGYEPVAPILFAKENVDAYYLEFDDERSGGFEPLREVSPNKKVVLGLLQQNVHN